MPTVPLDIQVPPAARQHVPRRVADRCPTAIALHPAADGLIARVRLPGGRLSAQQAHVLADWARTSPAGSNTQVELDGEGWRVAQPSSADDPIELTVRGNLQLRGLTAEQAGPLAAALHAAGLLPSEPHDQARSIVASPLAGRTPGAAPVDDLVRAIDAGLCAEPKLTALSGRFLTSVDDGARHVDVTQADLAVVAHSANAMSPGAVIDGPQATLLVGGVVAGMVAVADAPAAIVAAACAFVDQANGSAWRIGELVDAGAAVREGLLSGGIVRPARVRVAPGASALPPLGAGSQTDGRSAVRARPVLGRLGAAQLSVLADLAGRADTDLRFAVDRSVTLVDLAPKHVGPTLEALRDAGLVVDGADPSIGLTACAGLGCPKTRADVRSAARVRLTTRRAGAPAEHVVGCERRCGAPQGAATFVAAHQESPEALAERIRRAALETHR